MYIGIGIGFTYILYHNVLTYHDMISGWLSKPEEVMVIYILYILKFEFLYCWQKQSLSSSRPLMDQMLVSLYY